jgi:dienelactone hydrolase
MQYIKVFARNPGKANLQRAFRSGERKRRIMKNHFKQIATAVLLAFVVAGCFANRMMAQSVDDTAGPYEVIMEMDPSLPEHTIYRPRELAGVKEKLPIIAWGNGGCYAGGNFAAKSLSEIASYGFLVVANGAIDPTVTAMLERQPTAQGAASPTLKLDLTKYTKTSQLFETMDWAKTQNSKKGSPYKGKLDIHKIAAMGSSCGGLQALEAAADPRVKTAVIWNSGIIRDWSGFRSSEAQTNPSQSNAPRPGSPETLKKLHTPVIYIIGGPTDVAYKNAEQDFVEINHVPVFKANLEGAGHGGTASKTHGGEFVEVATKWLKWQLNGDQRAGETFNGDPCGLCREKVWNVERKNWK